MTTYQFSNNAVTTLGSAIAPTDTTIVVSSGTGSLFPNLVNGEYFTATIFASATGSPNEIVLVTARTGDSMTVVRGQEGTTAQAWSVGNKFSNDITAQFLNQLADSGALQQQAGNYAIDSGTANVGVITIVPVPASLTKLIGVPIRVKKVGAPNTAAYTVNANALGAINVLIGGAMCEGGEIVANDIFEIIYDGTQFNLISNPGTIHGDRITPGSVANNALAQMVAATVKGNLGSGTAAPYDIPISALAAALTGTGLVGQNGYLTLPVIISGNKVVFYVQWGNGGTSGAGNVSFSIPFPTACLNITVSDSGARPLAWAAPPSQWTLTGFHLYSSMGYGDYSYIAIGY